MTTKPLALLLIAVLFSPYCAGQNYIDLAQVFYSGSYGNKFENSSERSNLTEYGGSIIYPMVLKNNNAIITSIYYDEITTRLYPGTAEYTHVYTINPRIGVNLNHSKKWSGTYAILPQITSDLSGKLSGRDIQFGAIAILKYKKNETLAYRGGLYINKALFGPVVVGILGFYYRSPNEKWLFDLTLPISADINYKLSKKFSTGITFSALVRSYYLHQQLINPQPDYLVKSSNELYGYLQYDITKNLLLRGKLGYSLFRSYRTYRYGDKISWSFTGIKFGDDRQQTNVDFSDGPLIQFQLIYRYFLNN